MQIFRAYFDNYALFGDFVGTKLNKFELCFLASKFKISHGERLIELFKQLLDSIDRLLAGGKMEKFIKIGDLYLHRRLFILFNIGVVDTMRKL